MKTIKLLSGFLLIGLFNVSCYTEVILDDDFIEESSYNTDQVLQSYDLWYIDINETEGNGEVPFLQRAFTISFDHGVLRANNNLVGIGKTGNGTGIPVGNYNVLPGVVRIDHDLDGHWLLDVYATGPHTLELYNASTDTSYFLRGYQTNHFDYDQIFYDNIHYFLQEYEVWEKVYTSQEGAINEFDNENYLQFLSGNSGDFFRSSIDDTGTSIMDLSWDFEGVYQVFDVENDEMLKTLTLAYDFMGNDYFELYVINDSTIELYHPDSETVYQFNGKAYKQFLKLGNGTLGKKREKKINPVMKVKRKRQKL